MIKIGATAGTYDPVTNGHMELIKRAANLVDKLLVIISTGNSKTPLFTEQERYDLMAKEIQDYGIKNIKIPICKPNSVIEFMKENNVDTYFRGVRDKKDIDDENRIFKNNKDEFERNNIAVAHIRSQRDFRISSTEAKNRINKGEDINDIVSLNVVNALKEKYQKLM